MKDLARDILVVLLLAAATYAANENTLEYGFAYDDTQVILDREAAWEQGWGEFLTSRSWGVSRHLTLLSLDLNRGEKLSPYPFHVTNIALAWLLAALVYATGRRLELSRPGAFAAALVFTLHPVHVDAVVNIIGRAELLAAAFVILALLAHAGRERVGALRTCLASLLFLAAMFCKESAACFLVLAPLHDFFLGSDRRLRTLLPRYLSHVTMFAVWFAASWNNFHDIEPTAFVDNPLAYMPSSQRLLHASQILWFYVSMVVWPVSLAGDRSFDATPTDSLTGAIALLAWLLLAAVAWQQRRRAPRAGFLILWLPAAFAVTGNVAFPVGTIMAERLLLLPSVGLCLLGGVVLERFAGDSKLRAATASMIVAGVSVVLLFAYDARARVWQSDLHFHRQAVVDSPRSAKAHYNLGLALIHRDRREEAAVSLQRALVIHPGFSRAAYFLAELHAEEGDVAEASAIYAAYLEAKPNDVGSITRQIHLLMQLRRYGQARELAQRLVHLEEGNPEHGVLLGRLERLEAAGPVNP